MHVWADGLPGGPVEITAVSFLQSFWLWPLKSNRSLRERNTEMSPGHVEDKTEATHCVKLNLLLI